MEEVFADIIEILKADSRVQYISDRGGFITLKSMDEFPHQQKTPCVVLVDEGVGGAIHLMARTVVVPHRLAVNVVQRLFNKNDIVDGSPFYKSVEQVAKDVRNVLDMNRKSGKYMQARYDSEARVELISQDNIFLSYKPLIFEYVLVE